MTNHEFPIPFPGQMPNDDLAIARHMLQAVAVSMEDGEDLSSSRVQSLFNVLALSLERLEIIQLFLDDCDYPELAGQYRTARRLWVMSKGGAK